MSKSYRFDLDGMIVYYKDCNHRLHRLDGPAVTYPSGTKQWYQHGQLHRLDGPAVERSGGESEWRQNGKLHRLDGPAIVGFNNKYRAWFIDDKQFTKEEFEKQILIMKLSGLLNG